MSWSRSGTGLIGLSSVVEILRVGIVVVAGSNTDSTPTGKRICNQLMVLTVTGIGIG